ncbi:60S ribosomal protein L35 [Pseudolycoriella hygida]|uniref:Large ribosomal subunit protein uL29 n=1 Tax=Pseudolycoriella hygida TaxID=35572 RepID=A0A9Q0MN80_9DIPT|nr:60S ribosomal protein L35 [Pseudolycoriella hygida]
MPKVTSAELRSKDKKELLKVLDEFQTELHDLRVAQVTGGAPSKLSRIRVIRKCIARLFIVMNQKTKQNVRLMYVGMKFKPLDLRSKKTRAIRRALSSRNAKRLTLKEIRKKSAHPVRKFALKI